MVLISAQVEKGRLDSRPAYSTYDSERLMQCSPYYENYRFIIPPVVPIERKDLPREKSPNGPRFSTFNKNRKLCRPTDSILKFTQYHTNPLIFIQAISSKEETSVDKAYTRKRFWKWHSRREKYSKPSLIWSGKSGKHAKIPSFHDLEQNTDAKFLHICANETIQGVEYKDYPSPKNGVLVADMSSNFSSKPVDVSKFGFIYAGGQKNVGPSRVTIVIIKKDLIGNDGIYMCGLAYEDLLDQGGSVEVEKKNKKKAEILYNAYNGSIGFYRFPGEKSVRSLMNVPFTLEKSGLEIEFIKEAAMENMVQLKWHKSVGDFRARLKMKHLLGRMYKKNWMGSNYDMKD
ncbi:hypothetical protein CMV_016828 [Castanea mollissima]|uniref:phosphoserine transaminase n=1 Tax=Castanea mollissima TaxID=60419 RepID=A0A8J4QTA5_9ROSI|nr:hypothetical protein CMV_016828 [Castanea mollissima]